MVVVLQTGFIDKVLRFWLQREITLAVIYAIDKIPDHLCQQSGGLAITVISRVKFIKADRGQLIIKTGITCYLASLFTIKNR